MRVAVVFCRNGCEKVRKVADSLAKGIEQQGHEVQLVDLEREVDTKLTLFEYLLIGSVTNSQFTSQISRKISDFLRQAGSISGRKSYAFIVKKGLFPNKALRRLMEIMEKEGMILKISDVIPTVEAAESIGKKLHIK